MSFLKRLLGSSEPTRDVTGLPHPDQMPIADVWSELVDWVPSAQGGKLIGQLKKGQYAKTYAWLRPPTACPMAQSAIRSLVDYYRNPGEPFDNMVFVYQAESDEKFSTPTDDTWRAMEGLAVLIGVDITCFYRPEPGAEFVKAQITLNR